MKLNPMLLVAEEFDHTGILYNPDSSETFALNRTALFLYRQIEAGYTVEELSEQLAHISANTPDQEKINSDIQKFLSEMERRGWLSK